MEGRLPKGAFFFKINDLLVTDPMKLYNKMSVCSVTMGRKAVRNIIQDLIISRYREKR